MKTLLSVAGGAFSITEQSGVVSLNFDESVGGGDAAGVVKGQGSIILNGTLGLQATEKLLNAHLSASILPLAEAVEAVGNSAVAAIE